MVSTQRTERGRAVGEIYFERVQGFHVFVIAANVPQLDEVDLSVRRSEVDPQSGSDGADR